MRELGVFDLGYFSITKVYEPMIFKIMRVGVNNFQKKVLRNTRMAPYMDDNSVIFWTENEAG